MSKEMMQRASVEELSAARDRLDSWKEIAAYLGRQVRTVQRWEKQEGLPVHRHQHDKLGTVYACKPELDAWLESRAALAASVNEVVTPFANVAAASPENGEISLNAEAMPEPSALYDPSSNTTIAPSVIGMASVPPVSDTATMPGSIGGLLISDISNVSPISALEVVKPVNTRRSNQRRVIFALLFVALSAIAAGTYFTRRRTGSPNAVAGARIKLAVLPFENLGGNQDQEWFSDGLTEEMITQLGRLQPERLGVIGRVSVMRYKATQKNLAEIGSELGVDYVLEGSVRREGDHVRVTTQLIRVSDQTNLWADTFDKDLQSALALQTEIASHIAHSFAPKLWAGASGASLPAATNNAAAMDEYLKGRYLWHKGTGEAFDKSLECFEAAVKLDPQFAMAYAGIAEAHGMMGRYGIRPPAGTFPKARAAAERAIALDDSLAEAHAALGLVKFYWDWDWAAAETEYRRAIEINPGLATAHHGYAHFLSAMGRHDEAIAEVKRAQELEPLSATINSDAGWFYYRARRFDEAIAVCRRVLEIEPTFSGAQTCIIDALMQEGRFEQAWAGAKQFLTSPEAIAVIARINAADPKAAIRKIRLWQFEKLQQRAKSEYVSPYQFVAASVNLHEREQAFVWLERAFNARDRIVLLLKVHPMFDEIRDDPRFDNLMRRVGLPVT